METMDVLVHRSLIIPAPPNQPPSEVPFTVFDLVAPTYHVTVLYAFSAPNPSNAALLDALTATLPRFPLLTARIERHGPGNRPFFITGRGGAGALVVEASVASVLADHLPLAPSPDLASLEPPRDGSTRQHLLRLQINRFACGGLIIASSSHHKAADGYSMSTFLNAWISTARADPPSLDRPVPHGPGALVPRRPPHCEFEHRGAEFSHLHEGSTGTSSSEPQPKIRRPKSSEIANTVLHYSSQSLDKLKASTENKYTTFETLTAHLWRKITVARAGEDSVRTTLEVSVNGLARLGAESLPEEGFFGNAVLTATSRTTARDLAGGSLADAAALVRASIRAVDGRYFQSFIDFGELNGDEELEPMDGDEGYLLSSDSWLHLDLHKLDFGCGGRFVGIVPPRIPQDGVLLLMPSLHKGDGVDVFVALWDKHIKELKNIAYNMD